MSSLPPRLVVAPTAPPMTDEDYQSELRRHAAFFEELKSPARRRKASLHPDIARAVTGAEAAFRAAGEAVGAHDAETYLRALVAVRQAIGAWRSVDGQHGDITWRAAAS